MQYTTKAIGVVTLFASLLLTSVQTFAGEATLADLRVGSLLVFTRDLELDTQNGSVPMTYKSGSGFFATDNRASCFFVAEAGATSMVERGSAWRFTHAPRFGWHDYLATLKSETDGRRLLMICRKEPGDYIPLTVFLESLNQIGLQVTPALGTK